MKRLNNILSYFWSLLLLLTLTTCSDWEEIVVTMQGVEEVELTIQTTVPDMQASTREEMVITENISSIVAIAFDESGDLIKKVDAILSDQDHENHRGTLKIKVPKRTQTIHFLGNYTKNDIESITSLETLNSFATTDDTTMPTMRYWGMTTFDGSNINQPVTLYRNMAKVTLEAGNDDYIAGFLNYNTSGNIVPYSNEGFDFGSKKNYITLPNEVTSTSHDGTNESLGTEHYLFEHANEKNNNPLYAICNIGGKYYKIAFAYTNNGSVTYFDIIRNNAYKIVISDIDELYGEDSFKNAKNENTQPINDLVITEGVALNITADPAELPTTQGGTCSVTVDIPQGITSLTATSEAFIVTSNEVSLNNGSFDVSGKQGQSVTFTLTVNANATTGDKKVSFSGRGKYMTATGNTTIRLYENATLSISPTSVYNTAGSTTTVSVPIPQGITSLTATSEAFTVTSNEVSLNNGSFDVSGKQGQSVNFTLTLKDGGVGTVDETRTVTFSGSGDYKRATGTATVTLAEAPAQGSLPVYELWFEENNGWNGSNGYATFFTKDGDITTGNGNANNMEDTFYDGTFTVNDVTYSGADNHRSYAMTMGDGKSIGFTITEPRYLTLLVASSGNAPSIQLSNGTWITANSEDAVVPTNYNFGNGEIGTNGRLICYTLDPGTYTLQRGNDDKDYLLYYMRVSTNRPTMTDANALLQPTNDNYRFWWSGGEYGNWTYVENIVTYVVDDDAKTFNVALTDDYLNNNGITGGELSLNSLQLNVTNSSFNNNSRDYTNTNNNSNVEISEINSGTYTYTIGAGVINNPVYKYTNFYDKIPVSAVNGSSSITVKNSLKLKLVNGETSYNGKENIVEYYTTEMTDPRLAIVSPAAPLKPHDNNNPFVCTIQENWQFKGANNKQIESNGQQVNLVSQNGNAFTIANGTEHYNNNGNTEDWQHPFWMTYIYYFDWGSFTDENNTNSTLSDITIGTEDADVWFSYKGMDIAKNLTIKVNENPGEVVEPEGLDIALDFYSAENRDNNVYEDLLLGTSHLYLTATISAEDAAKYAGQNVTVTLNGEFGITQGQGKWSINWDGSRNAENSSIGSNISSSSNAFQLSFTIGYDNEGNPQTEYLIEWVFKTGQYYNAGEAIGFTYNISNYTISAVDGTFNNFTGDTSATIGFTNEPIGLEIYSDADTDDGVGITIASGDELVMKAIVPSDIPVGTEITFNLSNSIDVVADGLVWNEKNTSSVQFGWPNITLTVVENQRDYYLYWNPTVSGESHTATLSFTATIDDNSYNLNSVGNTSYSKAITVTPNNNQTTGTVVWNEGKTYADWSTDYIAVNTYIPTGSVITIYTSSTGGGAFEMHDIEERSLRFTNVNYPVNNDNYYSVASGETSHSFTVTNETTANGNSLANGVDGLKINGYNVTITRIVVQYPSMTGEVFNRNFEDGSTINGWGENVERRNAQEGENHYLVLANKSGGFAQASLDRAYVPGNYTLTYKIKGNASDSISQVFQYFNDNQNIYESVVGSQSVEFGTDDWTTVTLSFEVTRGCNRLLFDYSDFIGEIYIDDLRLVKND